MKKEKEQIINSNHHFRVIDNTKSRIKDFIDERIITYEYHFENIGSENFKIKIQNYNFKVIEIGVELGKPAQIIQEYTQVLCPMLFEVNDYAIKLCNHKEIRQRIEEKRKKLILQPEYFVEESTEEEDNTTDPYYLIDYMRTSFLNMIVENGQETARYYFSIGLTKMMLFCMQTTEDVSSYEFLWRFKFIDSDVLWKGKNFFDPVLNTTAYYGRILENEEFIEEFKKRTAPYKDFLVSKIKENLLNSSINHKTQFLNEELDFDFSETEIKIEAGTFYEYNQMITITAINNKNIS